MSLRKCLKIDKLEISQQRGQERLFQNIQISSLKAKKCGEGELGFKKSIAVGGEREKARATRAWNPGRA